MNWNDIGVRTTENGQKAEVGLWHPKDSLQRVKKQNKNIIKRRGVVQKAEVDLSCYKDSIQNIMKENEYVINRRGAVQKAEVCLNHHYT